MVMADDDEDSENDCLHIDESPTEPDNQESTSQNTPTLTNNTRNELPKNSAEVPQTVEAEQKARITCKDFSKMPFDTGESPPLLKSVNEMTEGSDTNDKTKESALYHYLTTDNAVSPEQEHTNTPNEGHQNPFKLELKHLLDAPSRPPTKSYPTVSIGTPYRRSSIQSNSRDPRTPPLTDVQNKRQLPHIQANETSVIVPHPGISAGGTITLKPTPDQQANNITATMRVNGYPIQNGQPRQLNSEASIRQMYSHTETRTTVQTSMVNVGGIPYRTCELNCPCRKGGPIPTSPLNKPTGRGRGLANMPLVNSQLQSKKPGRGRPRKNAANPPPTGRKGSINMPSLNSHPANPALNSYLNGRKEGMIDMAPLNNQVTNPKVNPDRNGMIAGPSARQDMPSLSPQPINHHLKGSTEGPMDTPHLNPNFNVNSEGSMSLPRLNPNLNAMTGGAMPHLHSQLRINPAPNPNFNARTEEAMDMSPNVNGITEGHMNIPHLHPHPSMNPVSYLDFHGRTGEPTDMPPHSHQLQNAHLAINPDRTMDMPPNLNGITEGPMTMPHLGLHLSMNPVLNVDLHGRTGGPMDIRPQSQQNLNTHQPINPERPMDMPHSKSNVSEVEYLDILQNSMNMYLLPQFQSMNPSLKMREERAEDPIIHSFNAQNQTTNYYLHHQFDDRKGHSLNISAFNPQLQRNALNSPPGHNIKMPQCYQCATGMPHENRSPSSHPNAQTGVAMTNSQTVPRNIRKDPPPPPQNPGYSNEENKRANYLASLRSQETVYSPSFPNNNASRQHSRANLRAARVKSLNNAELAGRPTHNNPTSICVYTPAQPYVSPARTYPIPNWAAFGTHQTVTEKRTVKTVTNTSTANIVAAKKAQEIPVPSSMIETLLPIMNTEIPHIDLTVDFTQNANTNITPNIISVPLNTDAQKPSVNMRIDTTESNITTSAHNINTINLMQVPLGEDQPRQIPMNVNNNEGLTHLMEASAHPEILTEDKAQTNSEHPWINIKRDGEKIPLLMDEEDMSSKNNVERAIQPSLIKLTDTIAQSVPSAFAQQMRNDIDVEAAVALLHANTDENMTNVTETSKAQIQSTNAFELVSTTSVISETMTHNINSNNISRPGPGILNAETNTTLSVSTKQVIENTVTVSLVKQIVTNPNIALPETDTLVDILNKVQHNSIKPILNIGQSDNSNIVTCNDNICTQKEKAQTSEGISLTTEEDKANISLLNILSRVKQTARKVCSNNDQTDTNRIGNFNEYIFPKEEKDTKRAMELSIIRDKDIYKYINNNMPVGDGNEKESSPETKELCDSKDDEKLKIARLNLARLRVTENKKENERSAQETDQEINEVDEPQENTNNERIDVLEPSIDELILFKFQINFFRLVQERLSKINNEVSADKLYNDILNLITLSEDEDATADMPYECHVCHNVTLYSPRQLYYYGIKILEDKSKKCQLCITFRKKYIEVLIKYIKQETSVGKVNNQITENTEHNNRRDDSATGFNNVSQTHSEDADHNDDNPNKHKNNEQQSLVTGEVPSCSELAKTKLGDEANRNMKNTPDCQKQTNSFVMKLPLCRLKKSTIKALIRCKHTNEFKLGENIALQDDNGKGNNNPEELTFKETVTTINGNRNISTTLNNNNENDCTRPKKNNAESSSSKSSESQNKNTNNLSSTIRDSGNRRSGTKNAPGLNQLPTNKDIITSSNNINNNNANEDEAIYDKTAISANQETQNINKINVPRNRDISNVNQKERAIKRKRISTETAPAANPDPKNRNTSSTSIILDDHNTNQELNSKKRKVDSVGTKTITSPDVEKQNSNTSTDNKNYNDRNQERHSKKRKSSSSKAAPSKNPESRTTNLNNVSEKNDDNQERHSKKRKSISTETLTIADSHDRHGNCNNNENNLKAKKSICDEITTTENKGNCDKDTPSNNNKIPKTKQPSASKSNETTTTNNVDSISNNNNGNRNKKQLCNSDRGDEIRRSVDAETTTSKTTQQLNVQEHASNKNKANDTKLAKAGSRKNTSKDITTKSQTTPSSNATSTDRTKNTTTQTHNKETAEQNHISKNNNGKKQDNHLDTRTDNKQTENSAKNHNNNVVEDVDVSKNNNNQKQNINTRKDDENDEEEEDEEEIDEEEEDEEEEDEEVEDEEEEEDDDENCTEVIKKALEECFEKLKARGNSNKKEIVRDFFINFGETLCPKESDNLPEVKITGKQEKKSQKVKRTYKYDCDHCSYRFQTEEACKSHVKDDHQKATVEAKDCIQMRKCGYCTYMYVPSIWYNRHLTTHHKDTFSRRIKN